MTDTLALMAAGFMHAISPINLLAMLASTIVGITIGCLPGLSAAMGVALLLPVTFGMDPATGLIVLGGIYCGAIFGGSISAILIHTPGTPASAATAIEGYQLTLRGKAAKALFTACFASFCGGLLSCISLYFFSPLLAQLAMKFKSPEYFWLSLFGLTIIAGVSSKSILKGLISGGIGLLISTIGMDPMEGVPRFMFGQTTLYNGVNTTCALIGLFSMSQVLILAEKCIVQRPKASAMTDRFGLSKAEYKRISPTIIRSWLIGNIVGILPGAGASIACFMGYNEARRFSKHKDEFGKGSIEGVAGSEAANNAVTGGSLIPTLTLGIPGESVTAVLMGGLIIHGLQPGPELFTTYAGMTYTFFAGFVLVQFFMLGVGMLGCKGFAQISRLSDAILIPSIFLLCVVGSYAIHNNVVEVVIMLIFGVIGYLARKFDFNAAAIVLGLILGPIGERGLRRSLLISDGDPSILFSTSLCWILIALCVLGVLSPCSWNAWSAVCAKAPKASHQARPGSSDGPGMERSVNKDGGYSHGSIRRLLLGCVVGERCPDTGKDGHDGAFRRFRDSFEKAQARPRARISSLLQGRISGRAVMRRLTGVDGSGRQWAASRRARRAAAKAAVAVDRPAHSRPVTRPVTMSPVPPMHSMAGTEGLSTTAWRRPSWMIWSALPLMIRLAGQLPCSCARASSTGMFCSSASRKPRV